MNDTWNNASNYEFYIGRWSRMVAVQFLKWLYALKSSDWLDIGCGTGALSKEILRTQSAHTLTGIDPSADYVAYSNEMMKDDNSNFLTGDAIATGLADRSFDVIVSGLVLNFISDIPKALAEFRRVARENSTVAAYVWD